MKSSSSDSNRLMLHNTDGSRVDQIIDEVSDPRESQCELLREHLESARTYILGDMPEEYQLSLRLAIEAIDCIADEARRHRVNEILSELMAEKAR